MNTNNNIFPTNTVGLIKGRHPIPVEDFIWEEELPKESVTDYPGMARHVERWITAHCRTRTGYGVRPINGNDSTDIECWCGDPLNVVVTGLTAATAAVIDVCAIYGVPLTLWHYDREADVYRPQRMSW